MKLHPVTWLAVALVTWAGGAARADEAPIIKYRPTEFVGVGDSGVVLRGSFEVTAPPHRNLGVYFTLWLEPRAVLRGSGKDLIWHWGTVVTPSNGKTWEWNDCRIGIPLNDISAAENLPKGRTTDAFGVCDVYDFAQKKYLGSGWDTRVALRITTDETGKVLSVTAADKEPAPPTPTPPPPPPAVAPRGTGYKLALKYLTPKPGVTVSRTKSTPGSSYFRIEFFQDGKSVPLSTELFESVDTADKARELVELSNPGDLLIQTAEQYKAVADYFEGDRRFFVMLKDAPSHGATVSRAASGGFTVQMLHYMPYPKYLGVTRSTWTIPARGAIRFSVFPLVTPSDPSLRLTAEQGRRINQAVERLLRPGGLVILGDRLVVPR